MKPLIALLSLVAAGFGAFGYWGVYTPSGRKRYDEMAGIIPETALLVSFLLFLIILIIIIVFFSRKRKK